MKVVVVMLVFTGSFEVNVSEIETLPAAVRSCTVPKHTNPGEVHGARSAGSP